MSIDLSRFHAVFFSESLEQLDAMEAELLKPDIESASAESINTIFRAAHSVKGGSATFGFTHIAGLTHVLETILDEVRSGKRPLDRDLVDLLLESVDCLRDLLRAGRDGGSPDETAVNSLQSRLNALVSGEPTAPAVATETDEQSGAREWIIRFRPHRHLLQRGNDPYRLLRELGDLGDMVVTSGLDQLPAFGALDPEECFLEWRIELRTERPQADIQEIFEWVEHDCDLEIEAVEASPEAPAAQPEPQAAPAPASAPQAPQVTDAGVGAHGSIRVDVDKIDQLVNLVGELIITESRLVSLLGTDAAGEMTAVGQALENLSRNIRDLQESALQMRMVPVSFAFHRLPRLVRDVARELGKEVVIEIRGEQTEVDKGMLENISDPLIHLVRNAVDHGIEMPEVRKQAGKPGRATIDVRAFHQGGNVVIEVTDDGKGLDPDLIRKKAEEKGLLREEGELSDADALNLIFSPGFSTAEQVSDISGRGVGLDVVRQNIQKLGGRVHLESKVGKGTRFTIAVPLTLSIIEGQLVRIGQSAFVVPVLSIVESVRFDPGQFRTVAGEDRLYRFRDGVIPLLELGKSWDLEHGEKTDEQMVVIVEWGRDMYGLLVDRLLDQQQIVLKSLEENFRRVSGLAGATILGDGAVALILDIGSLGVLIGDRRRHQRRRREREDEA